MKRNAGAREGDGKLEARFAALTSGLLARKGHAAPSNSPIHDPAEETDAFAIEPTRKPEKKKTPVAAAPPAPATRVAPAEPPRESKKPSAPPPVKTEPPAKSLPAGAKSPSAPAAAQAAAMTVINERSLEAGYPDNPSAEEIAALDAEADEVVSYFENFGNEDAVAAEKAGFYGDEGAEKAAFDPLETDDDELSIEALPTAPAGPWSSASVPAVAGSGAATVRAAVTAQLTAREFMRLSLGAAELQMSSQDLIAEAIEEYLDGRGVISLGGCSCLDALKKPGA